MVRCAIQFPELTFLRRAHGASVRRIRYNSPDRARRFVPPHPSDHPTALFVPQDWHLHGPRYVRRTNGQEALIHCDGVYIQNAARMGCAVVRHPSKPRVNEAYKAGPYGRDGRVYPLTSLRAELCAALSALRRCEWYIDGFTRVVVATSSHYTVDGIAERVWKWEQKGWRTAAGKPMQNRDLWEALSDEVKRLEGRGIRALFWLIPRQWNEAAGRRAREVAALPDPDLDVRPV